MAMDGFGSGRLAKDVNALDRMEETLEDLVRLAKKIIAYQDLLGHRAGAMEDWTPPPKGEDPLSSEPLWGGERGPSDAVLSASAFRSDVSIDELYVQLENLLRRRGGGTLDASPQLIPASPK